MSKKTVLVLGATAGHSLIIWARTPSKLPDHIKNSPGVSVIEGQFADAKAQEKAAKCGADVLATFMGPVTVPNRAAPAAFYKDFLPQVSQNGIKRALMLTTPSFITPQDKGALKWTASTTLVKIIGFGAYGEMKGIVETVTAIPLDTLKWTVFRVGWLNNGPAQPVAATYTGSGEDSLGISRASIA